MSKRPRHRLNHYNYCLTIIIIKPLLLLVLLLLLLLQIIIIIIIIIVIIIIKRRRGLVLVLYSGLLKKGQIKNWKKQKQTKQKTDEHYIF